MDDLAIRLLEDERILWSGRPAQGLRLTPADALLIPFSIVWCAFVTFWEAAVIAVNAPLLFKLWGVPFILVGLYLLAGRFCIDAWLRERTRYAVTNRRILITRSGRFAALVALDRDKLPVIEVQERRDGHGTITFGQAPSQLVIGPMRRPRAPMPPQFVAIDNVRHVFDLIQQWPRAAERSYGWLEPIGAQPDRRSDIH
jgi:hypothetical protein